MRVELKPCFSKRFRSLISQVGLMLIVCALPSQLMAFELSIQTEDGAPLADAFVAIAQGDIVNPNPEPARMDQANVKFVPHVLAIDVGQSVVFPNSDNIRHHVYSFSKPKQFEIKLYQGVPKQPVLFEQPGLVALGCNIHDAMVGYIFVSPWPEYAVSGLDGSVTLSKPVDRVAVWHPWLNGEKTAVMMDVDHTGEGRGLIKLAVAPPKLLNTFKKFRRGYDDD